MPVTRRRWALSRFSARFGWRCPGARLGRFSWLVVMMVVLLASPARSLTPLPPTVPPGVTPQWTRVPGNPAVAYAPNLKVDLFRHQGVYYYWVAGGWRTGQNPRGPWFRATEVPPAILNLDPSLFKSVYKPRRRP
jgi:hypothetical protein